MIIHWAGAGSKVIVALTRDIKQTGKSSSNLYISEDYGRSFNKKRLRTGSKSEPVIERFYNSPVYKSHVSVKWQLSFNFLNLM